MLFRSPEFMCRALSKARDTGGNGMYLALGEQMYHSEDEG